MNEYTTFTIVTASRIDFRGNFVTVFGKDDELLAAYYMDPEASPTGRTGIVDLTKDGVLE